MSQISWIGLVRWKIRLNPKVELSVIGPLKSKVSDFDYRVEYLEEKVKDLEEEVTDSSEFSE